MKSVMKISNTAHVGVVMLCLVCFTACDSDKIYQEEQYKNVVYLLSGSENVYTEGYTLNETEPVRYFSVGIGGTNPNEDEITVTLVPDDVLLNQYNSSNFDIDESKFARLLPANRYEIESYTVTIPAQPEDQYVKVPVRVRPRGLSPDTIYFIPIAIKSVSRYEVNQDKYNMLYRVTIENDYAQQRVITYYTKKGTETNQSSGSFTIMSGAKIVQPLMKNMVRLFAGNYTQGQTTTVADIHRYAIMVQINDDNTIDFFPYGSIEVEKIEAKDYNIYDPKVKQGDLEYRVMYLSYRYRILNSNGTRGAWMETKESLTRVEEN